MRKLSRRTFPRTSFVTGNLTSLALGGCPAAAVHYRKPWSLPYARRQ